MGEGLYQNKKLKEKQDLENQLREFLRMKMTRVGLKPFFLLTNYLNWFSKSCFSLKPWLCLIVYISYFPVKSECYAAASYQTTTEKYVCRLHQSNWASEAMFEVKFLHCLEEPTVNVFIRNFYGVDEINMNFDRLTSNWKYVSLLIVIADRVSSWPKGCTR